MHKTCYPSLLCLVVSASGATLLRNIEEIIELSRSEDLRVYAGVANAVDSVGHFAVVTYSCNFLYVDWQCLTQWVGKIVVVMKVDTAAAAFVAVVAAVGGDDGGGWKSGLLMLVGDAELDTYPVLCRQLLVKII